VSDSDLSNILRLAFRALLVVAGGASERAAIQRSLVSEPKLASVRRQALGLVLATLREQDRLDWIIREALPNKKLDTRALCILRLVAHNAKLCVDRDHLRRLERSIRNVFPVEYLSEIECLLGRIIPWDNHRLPSTLPEHERIALETHHPAWWVDYCFRIFGRARAITLLSARPRPRYLRVNTLKNRGKTTLPAIVRHVASSLTRIPSLPGAYSLSGLPSTFSEFFSQGLFQMQDLASFLAVKAGDPKPDENVLDLCAAPGGKTAALAQLMRNKGRIISVDYSRPRMNAWKREIKRLGVKIAEPIIGNATGLGLRTKFDLVVIDPPCTGTGIFDRNPSMKWHLSAKSLSRYAELQESLLDSASRSVAEEGRILYCTCSITVEENEDIVRSFLKSHPEFETRPILDKYGSPGLRGMSDCRRLYPDQDKTAGYFIATMQRGRD
jgi:16S rRNA (cytosine967-C5)-methyltransferase